MSELDERRRIYQVRFFGDKHLSMLFLVRFKYFRHVSNVEDFPGISIFGFFLGILWAIIRSVAVVRKRHVIVGREARAIDGGHIVAVG